MTMFQTHSLLRARPPTYLEDLTSEQCLCLARALEEMWNEDESEDSFRITRARSERQLRRLLALSVSSDIDPDSMTALPPCILEFPERADISWMESERSWARAVLTTKRAEAAKYHAYPLHITTWNITSLTHRHTGISDQKARSLRGFLLDGPVLLQETKWGTEGAAHWIQRLPVTHIADSPAPPHDTEQENETRLNNHRRRVKPTIHKMKSDTSPSHPRVGPGHTGTSDPQTSTLALR